jgi:hypothetical protein
MKIDSTELLDEIKESSIKNLIETFNSLKIAWEMTTKNYPFPMKLPILLIPIVFNKYSHEEESFSFFFLTPHILNEDGKYSLDLYTDVAYIVKGIPDILCYGILGEDEGSYFIEFEDLRECVTIKCNIDEEGILKETSREIASRISILSFPESSVPN